MCMATHTAARWALGHHFSPAVLQNIIAAFRSYKISRMTWDISTSDTRLHVAVDCENGGCCGAWQHAAAQAARHCRRIVHRTSSLRATAHVAMYSIASGMQSVLHLWRLAFLLRCSAACTDARCSSDTDARCSSDTDARCPSDTDARCPSDTAAQALLQELSSLHQLALTACLPDWLTD